MANPSSCGRRQSTPVILRAPLAQRRI